MCACAPDRALSTRAAASTSHWSLRAPLVCRQRAAGGTPSPLVHSDLRAGALQVPRARVLAPGLAAPPRQARRPRPSLTKHAAHTAVQPLAPGPLPAARAQYLPSCHPVPRSKTDRLAIVSQRRRAARRPRLAEPTNACARPSRATSPAAAPAARRRRRARSGGRPIARRRARPRPLPPLTGTL
ncbi:MAG: hypothetical protein J3K34DRAFT_424515, partial [Monoraphidium minutum]